MIGRLKKIDDKWVVEYPGVSYTGGNPKQLGSYTKKIEKKTLPLHPNFVTMTDYVWVKGIKVYDGDKVEFTQVLVNPMGREVDPNDLGKNLSKCKWYAKPSLVEKEEQKQHLIDMMRGDEELGLYDDTDTSEWGIYDESREIKFEDVFNDEKREKVKRVILQHKVLQGLSLINPLHLRMTDNGHGEFPDGYKLTEKGIQYIIEQLNKE
jgi:hypothetical protein